MGKKDKPIPLGGERGAVQNRILTYVGEPSVDYGTRPGLKDILTLGWEYISPADALALRAGEEGFVFRDLFLQQMQVLNPAFMTPAIAQDLMERIKRIPANIEGNLAAWEYLKGLKTAFVPKEKRERNVTFIDRQNLDRNIYQVTDEFWFSNGSKRNRADVVFLINGVPVILVETKSAHKTEGMAEALKQVRRYHDETPEFMALSQLYAITHIIHFYYSPTWELSAKTLFNWKEEAHGNFETLVKTFFSRERVVKTLTDFILFTRQDDELKKVVLRPHQMRTVGKIVDRAKDKSKSRGLVWHTQGSGKTYTMIVAAQKILDNPAFDHPLVVMLVDRNELETQLFGNLSSVGIETFAMANSKRDLQKLLSTTKRGLIVSMIHKFEGIPADINTSKNIFILVDEAHRTTTGTLGNYLMGALPNATYIGFTGTPIDKTAYGQGTFKIFGIDDPPKGYLDKYSIAESIHDKTTVPLHYTLAPNDLRVDRETLEKEFFSLAALEGVSDIEVLNKTLEKAVTLRNMLKNRGRVEKVAKFVAKHYKENVEPMGYKAFLVGVDREACALYKKALDQHLPQEYSQVVYSAIHNDPKEIAAYHLSDTNEKKVRKAFRHPDELPKILIVTEKLLTGYDAPILYAMYLDKPMRDHVLLQAIARVNRPCDAGDREKKCGFILDFVGIFENLEKALAFDSSDIGGIVQDLEVLKGQFAQKIEQGRVQYLSLITDKPQDKVVEDVLAYFMDEEQRQTFYAFFKQVQSLYDILSPDAFLRPYIRDYEALAKMYAMVIENYIPKPPITRDFSKKTAELVQKHTATDIIQSPVQVVALNEELLKKLEKDKSGEITKVFNLVKKIRAVVGLDGSAQPYLISIGDKAEKIIQMFLERQRTTLEALEELKALIREIIQAQKEQAAKGLSGLAFSVYWVLKKMAITQPEPLAESVTGLLEQYPHWTFSEDQNREVRKELYTLLLDKGIGVDEVKEQVDNLLRILRGFKDHDTGTD